MLRLSSAKRYLQMTASLRREPLLSASMGLPWKCMPGGFGFGPIRPWRTAGTPPALSPQRDPGASPRLAKSGRPLQCPSRTLHVSHERVSFTFPNCYAVDNGPGYPGHRVSYLFQTCRQPGPADPPGPGYAGRGSQGQNGLVCPGWPPARKKPDPQHAGLGRVSAGRGATRLAES